MKGSWVCQGIRLRSGAKLCEWAFGVYHLLDTLEAQLPIYWVPVLETLCNYILSVTQGPTIWVPGLLGILRPKGMIVSVFKLLHCTAAGLRI